MSFNGMAFKMTADLSGFDGTSADYTLDVSGQACPMPLLKAKQKLNAMQPGELLRVIATDAGSQRDFSSFVALSTHMLLSSEVRGESYIYLIKKGA